MGNYFIEKTLYRNGKERQVKITAIKVNCGYCKKEFLRANCRKIKTKPFCTKKCADSSRSTLIDVDCAYCKGEIKIRSKLLLKSKSGLAFCDRKCKDLAQRINSGIPISPEIYGTGIQFKQNLEKSKGSCSSCGKCQKYTLNIHHIDGDRSNNNLNNLIVLCSNCHCKRHLELIDGEWKYNSKVLTPLIELEKIE